MLFISLPLSLSFPSLALPRFDLFLSVCVSLFVYLSRWVFVFLGPQGVVFCWGRADSGQLGIGAEWVHETSSGVMGVEWPRRVRGLLEGRRTVRRNKSKSRSGAMPAAIVSLCARVCASLRLFVFFRALFAVVLQGSDTSFLALLP